MLQKIWWLWPKGPPYEERENRAWNQERENGFLLGRNARGRIEQGTACCLWEDTKRVCVRAKEEEAAQEIKRKESSQEEAA